MRSELLYLLDIVEACYLDDWREIPVDEAEEAVENAEEVMKFVRSKVNL